MLSSPPREKQARRVIVCVRTAWNRCDADADGDGDGDGNGDGKGESDGDVQDDDDNAEIGGVGDHPYA